MSSTDHVVATAPDADIARLLGIVQLAVLVLVVGLRPFLAGNDPWRPDHLFWLSAVVAGWLALVVELVLGLRRELLWHAGLSWAGAALLLALPAAFVAPDPAPAWGWYLSWGGLWGSAAWLLQHWARWRRLIVALLLGALMVEGLVALGQEAWALPAIRAQIAAGDADALLTAGGERWVLAERAVAGGIYGSMTLANFLSAWALALGLLATGLLVAQRRSLRADPGQDYRPTLLLLAPLVLALVVAWLAAAKGPPLLAALALAWALAWRLGGWRQALIGGLLLAAGIGVVAVPALRHLAGSSLAVRLDYWAAGLPLLGEAPLLGHGLGSWADETTRTLALGAEYARHAHNVFLELAVEAGLAVAALLLAACSGLIWRRDPEPPAALGEPDQPPRWLPVLPLLLLPYATLVWGSLLSDNLAFWPGHPLLWSAILGAVLGGLALVFARLPDPPAWALRAAALVLLGAWCIDFHLHEIAAAAGLAVLAALVMGPRARRCAAGPRLGGILLAALLLGDLPILVGAWFRAAQLGNAEQMVEAATRAERAFRRGDEAGTARGLAEMAWLRHGEHDPEAQQQARAFAVERALAAEYIHAQASRWPAHHELARRAIALHIDPARQQVWLAELLPRQPHAHALWASLATLHLQQRELREALACWQEALRLAPRVLRYRQDLAQVHRGLAASHPGEAADHLAAAERLEAGIRALWPQSHFQDRQGVPPPE